MVACRFIYLQHSLLHSYSVHIASYALQNNFYYLTYVEVTHSYMYSYDCMDVANIYSVSYVSSPGGGLCSSLQCHYSVPVTEEQT